MYLNFTQGLIKKSESGQLINIMKLGEDIMTDFDSLLKWANENKARGCIREDMRTTAISGGWNIELVDRVLSTAFNELEIVTNLKVEVQEPKDLPGSNLFNTKTSITVGGRKIKIALVSKLPKAVVFENFLSDEECDQLIELSRASLTRSQGFDLTKGTNEVTSARTSKGTFFRKGSHPLVNDIDARIAETINWPVEKGEDLQVLHYENGERYIPHHDYFHEEFSGSQSVLQRGGNRVATFLMYLATPEEGGATLFPETGLSVFPQKGNALFFVYPTPTRDTKTLHSGEPVTLGEKYVATKWLRQGEFK